jgi:ribosomal protein L32
MPSPILDHSQEAREAIPNTTNVCSNTEHYEHRHHSTAS